MRLGDLTGADIDRHITREDGPTYMTAEEFRREVCGDCGEQCDQSAEAVAGCMADADCTEPPPDPPEEAAGDQVAEETLDGEAARERMEEAPAPPRYTGGPHD
jgi:hypothetical protein